MSFMPRKAEPLFLDYYLNNCEKLGVKADDSMQFISRSYTLRELVEDMKRDTAVGKAFYWALTLDPQVQELYEEFKKQ